MHALDADGMPAGPTETTARDIQIRAKDAVVSSIVFFCEATVIVP